MKIEKSCGAVIYTIDQGEPKYVIIRSKEGIYGFPKGHTEAGESEKTTALREVFEETGLRVELIKDFRTEDQHVFERGGEDILKHIVYFLGSFQNQKLTVQESELSGLELMDYEKAMGAFQYESSRRILTEAHRFLTGKKTVKAIFLDLDGTLNNDQKIITEKTKAALMDAQKRGIRLVLASARPSPGLFKERDILRLQDYGGILMSYNGGRIVDAKTGAVLFETAMELQQTKTVLRFLEKLPVTPILDDGKQFYVTDKTGYKVAYECQNNRMECTEVENLADFLRFSPVKTLMSVLPERIAAVQKEIAAFLPPELTVVQTAPFYLEVIPASINKGQGLLDTCTALGIDPAETVAFGDAENDIPMLKAAGVGVAMGNAAENVKAAADGVTRSNNEDGIAAWLTDK